MKQVTLIAAAVVFCFFFGVSAAADEGKFVIPQENKVALGCINSRSEHFLVNVTLVSGLFSITDQSRVVELADFSQWVEAERDLSVIGRFEVVSTGEGRVVLNLFCKGQQDVYLGLR